MSTPVSSAPTALPYETAARYWLAYQSGLSLRRAKNLLAPLHSQSLYEILSEPPELWGVALNLTPEERQRLETSYDFLTPTIHKLADWQKRGVHLLHWDEAAYPPTLAAHLRPEQRPLFVSYCGDPGLFELPTILALAGDPPDADASVWTIETLLSLADESALPLAIARHGLDADIVRALLAAEAPFALVLTQGLAAYQPPAALAGALAAGRALLLSPFRPDQTSDDALGALLPHAAAFAQAFANALLIITPPHPSDLLPEQPCFLRPGLPKTLGCQTYYTDPEDLFLRLAEIPAAAAAANLSFSPEPPPPPPPPPPPAPDPETLIARLSELGHVPEAMKERLRGGRE